MIQEGVVKLGDDDDMEDVTVTRADAFEVDSLLKMLLWTMNAWIMRAIHMFSCEYTKKT